MRDHAGTAVIGFGRRQRARLGLLVPNDGRERFDERVLQQLVDRADRVDGEALLHVVRNLGQVLLIVLGDEHGLETAAQRRQQLLLQAANRQHAAAQGDLAGHGDVLAHRIARQHRDDRSHHGHAGRRPVLGRGALGHVNVDVLLLEDGWRDAEGGATRLDVAFRRLHRFLHHVAELAGGRDLALAGHDHRFDRQQLAADLGPGQPGCDADQIGLLHLAIAEAANAGVFLQIPARDRDALQLAHQDFLDRLAGKIGELALEIPDAGLARVIADEILQRVVGDRPFRRLEAVRLDLLRNEVAPRDLDLFVLGVTGDADDLHAVHQRLRHAQRVGRGDEHHVRQIVIDLEIMVVEGRILLGIEHLQQRRGRIAAPIGAELVHLVQQEERVRGLRLLHALNDLAGHGADIGSAVAADFGLVAHAAQRHAHEAAPGGPRHRLAERGLAHAGRSDQTQDRPLYLAHAVLHREVFEDAFLDLLQAVMIVVEHAFGGADVALHLGAVLPGNRQQPVEIVAHHLRLGRHRTHGAKFLHFAQRLVARLFGKFGFVDAFFELGEFVAAVLALAQLLLDLLELLVEVVLPLRLFHLALDARADALLDLENAYFTFHVAEDLFQALGHALGLEQLLLLGNLQHQVGRQRIGELRGVLDLVYGNQNLGRDLLVELDVVLELGHRRARQRLELLNLAGLVGNCLGIGLKEGLVLGEAHDARAAAAFDQRLDRAVGQLQELQHRAYRSNRVNIRRGRIVLRRVLLRYQQNLLVVLHHVFERAHRFLAADEQRHDHVREDDDVSQRQDGIQITAGQIQHNAPFEGTPAGGGSRGHGGATQPRLKAVQPLYSTFVKWRAAGAESRAALGTPAVINSDTCAHARRLGSLPGIRGIRRWSEPRPGVRSRYGAAGRGLQPPRG